MDAEAQKIAALLESYGLKFKISETDSRKVSAWADECQSAGLERAAAVDLACRLYANRCGAALAHRTAPARAAKPAAAVEPTAEEQALAAEIVKFASNRR